MVFGQSESGKWGPSPYLPSSEFSMLHLKDGYLKVTFTLFTFGPFHFLTYSVCVCVRVYKTNPFFFSVYVPNIQQSQPPGSVGLTLQPSPGSGILPQATPGEPKRRLSEAIGLKVQVPPPLSTANVEALAKLSSFVYDSTTPVPRSSRSSSTTCSSSLAPSYPSSPTLEGGVKLAALRGQGKRRHSESVNLNMSMLDVDQAQQGTVPSLQRRRHSETATLGGGSSSHMAQECLRAASMVRLEKQLGVGLLFPAHLRGPL
jgi:hypothetical protein